MTITRRILLQIAAATGLVLVVASGVTYRLVYRAAEQQAIAHLSDYVGERARLEETKLRHIQTNLEVARGQFLKTNTFPVARDYQQQWDHWFEKSPDGATRSRREFADGRKWPTLWAHRDAPLTPEEKTLILRANNICNQFLPGWIDSFPSFYFVFPFQANIGFDPRIPNWVWDTPADYDNNAIEAVATANPENNPSRGIVWNSVLAEPTSQQPYVAVMLPIDTDGQNIATIGHDIHALQLLDDSTRSSLPGVTHCIFRADGKIIAHRELMPRILASKGMLTMEASGDAMLRGIFATTAAQRARQFSGVEETSGAYYSISRLVGPEWLFLTTMPGAHLREQAFRSAQWVLWSGLLSLALVLGLFALILRRQIARPLAELARATSQMSAGDTAARATVHRADELGDLAAAFNGMVERVTARDAALRGLNQDLERQVDERTAELRAALAAEHELSTLKTNFVSMVSHEFRTPLGVIVSAADVLDRYLDRLTPDKRRKHLDMIFRATKNLAQLVEGVLLLGKVEDGRMQFTPAPVDLASVCHQLVDEVHSATGGNATIDFTPGPNLDGAQSDPELLRHIFGNLLSNAAKYSEPGARVTFTIERSGSDAVVIVRDLGIGISAEDQANLFKSFARGSNVGQRPGTGLGLLIVQRCVDLHGGSVEITSRLGEGTTVAVRLPVFAQLPTLNSQPT